jgi:hypothetical protein
VSADLAAQVSDSLGELFVPVEMPEPPKASFLKGVSTLFTGTSKDVVDHDQMCRWLFYFIQYFAFSW